MVVPGKVTVTQATQTVQVKLYTDALCTTEVSSSYLHNFGTVAEGGTPQLPLWFKASEINPTTVSVSDDLAGYDVQFLVGTPMASVPGKPCTLALWLPNTLPAGVYEFNFTVTGTGP